MEKRKFKKSIKTLYYDDDEVGNVAVSCQLAERISTDGETQHNCFACNLASSINTLKKLGELIDEDMNQEEIYRLFLPQIYLISEEIGATLEASGLSYEYINSTFPFRDRVRKLMNFLKHPKLRGFFKHPAYSFVKNSLEVARSSSKEYFCEKDIQKFFSRENKDLTKKLADYCEKENLEIKLPCISDLINDLAAMIYLVIDKYENNSLLYEPIESLAINWGILVECD